MTTLAEIRAIIRVSIPDVVAWPDTTLDIWIKAGIRHYSGKFPRLWMNSITAVVDTQSYDLPANATLVETVEFPAGQFPPRYLTAVLPIDPRMMTGGAAYILTGTDDGGTAVQNGRLTIAPIVDGGETLTIGYRAPHPVPAADESVITVPDQHLGIIEQYCEWSAYQSKLSKEIGEPYRNMSLVGQLTESVDSAWDILGEMMASTSVLSAGVVDELMVVEETAVTSSTVVVWADENTERIY